MKTMVDNKVIKALENDVDTLNTRIDNIVTRKYVSAENLNNFNDLLSEIEEFGINISDGVAVNSLFYSVSADDGEEPYSCFIQIRAIAKDGNDIYISYSILSDFKPFNIVQGQFTIVNGKLKGNIGPVTNAELTFNIGALDNSYIEVKAF